VKRNSELSIHWEAYRTTAFFAETPLGELCLHVGETHADLDTLLERYAVDSWAYITACNPASVHLSDADNEDRQRRLEAEIKDAGHLFFLGHGVGQDDQWPAEPSLLILGIPEAEAIELGQKFGQAAIVVGRRREPARLAAC